MKKILLCGLLFLFTGQVFAAKKGKGKAKEADLTSQFFDVIAQSFTLNEGVVINDSNFGRAIEEVKYRILSNLPEEMANNVDRMLDERRWMRELSQVIDEWITNNELLKNIVSDKQKNLNGLTSDIINGTIKDNVPTVIMALFYMTMFNDVRGEKSRAFLKMFFESEAKRKTEILSKDEWTEGFSSLIRLSCEVKQEVFFFPLFAQLVDGDVINVAEAKLSTSSSFLYDTYGFLFDVVRRDGEKSNLTPYVHLMKSVIRKTEKIDEDDIRYYFHLMKGILFDGLNIGKKEGKELLTSIIQKDLDLAAYCANFLFKRLFDLHISKEDDEFKKVCFELIDQSAQVISQQPKAGSDEKQKLLYSQHLYNFVKTYNPSEYQYSLITRPPYNKELYAHLFKIIKAFYNIGADINYHPEDEAFDFNSSILFMITGDVDYTKGTGIEKKLKDLGAKLRNEEELRELDV
jgi:hypothetical protein